MAAPPSAAHRASANENPFTTPSAVREAVAEAATATNRYPEVYPSTLAAAIARHHGVDEECVAVGAGGSGLIQQMMHLAARSRGEVVTGWRSFEGYPAIGEAMGVRVRRVPLRDDHVQDLAATAKAVRRKTRIVFVCNPNNPTGTTVRHQDVRALLDRVPRRVFVVLDEVYREFTTDPDAADGLQLVGAHPNVLTLRSFSKAYGLADLRVGYAVGAPGPIAALRQVTMPFLVPRVAQEAAVAALDVADEYAAQRRTIVAERDRMADQLRRLGYSVPPAEGNFVWLPLADRTADFAAACEAAGVQVHAFAGEGVRVTVGTAEANEAVLTAAASFVGERAEHGGAGRSQPR